ncbi:amidohydrolase [Herbaspirillum sp. LeCh32-8]|uniref:amidohydrolase family protein n=1 Tax=Herbaspirillum sp. LeCh32-8 TaxID=2821356 RepID=UPI001AE95FE9|nr:amidohydrolase family protein [Herbaspirillum sp. LeCh32-8]MBP0598914.1 amidohydrolase [Herbaspirillum sp. LeCh32-8]
MIIDCHGHYTTSPAQHQAWRTAQLAALRDGTGVPPLPRISDDQIRDSIETGQLRIQRERGTDLTIFSPRAASMAHHDADANANAIWSAACNDLVHRVCTLFPRNFIGVCQLPQAPGADPAGCVAELRRCVQELGFIGCNLNPDPSGGHWSGAPMTDRSWYPLYEALVELDVPAMIHVSSSCNPNFHATGAHYLNGDTTVFMQLIEGDLFADFPTLKFIIPHGGGAAPYHWGRYRGLAQDMQRPLLEQHVLQNVFFDTCVYHQPGAELLAKVIPTKNILFASETIGAVRGIDPQTGFHYDDTRRYIDAIPWLDDAERAMIFEGNARTVYSRLTRQYDKQTSTLGVPA